MRQLGLESLRALTRPLRYANDQRLCPVVVWCLTVWRLAVWRLAVWRGMAFSALTKYTGCSQAL